MNSDDDNDDMIIEFMKIIILQNIKFNNLLLWGTLFYSISDKSIIKCFFDNYIINILLNCSDKYDFQSTGWPIYSQV